MYTPLENTPQGSAAWLAARAKHFCASEAAAALGMSKYAARDELLRQKATGLTEEVSPAKQRLFDAGHQAEALARPIAEGIAGTEFFPVVATREVEGMPLLASFDGIDLLDEVIWEHKLLNESLVQQVQAGGLEPHYWLQLEHQLLVSGATRALFTTSDGTPEGTHPLWYESKPERRAQLIAGWKQFAADLAAWKQPEAKPAPVVAEAMESLPAVSVRLDGKLAVVSNLPDFAAALRTFIARIPAKPDTDQDFANAESACKALKRAEDALTAGEDAALGEMVDFEAMRRQVRDLKELARATRLATEKMVTARKEQIRGEIVAGGVAALREHIASLNTRLGKPYMPQVPADFSGAIKGKRTVESLRGAVNDELARAKIESSAIADRIQINLGTLRELAGAHAFLFADTATIVLKQPDDLTMLVKARIADHQAAEQARLDAERERIRREEQERADREARAKLAAEQKAAQAALQGQIAQPVAADLSALATEHCAEAVAGLDAKQVIAAAKAGPAPDTGETMTLGQLNALLSPIKLDASGIEALGFATTRVKAAVHFPAARFPALCEAIARCAMEAAQARQEAAA